MTGTPPADQVRALLDRAADARLTPDEQRLIGDLLRQARASLAGLNRAASYRTAALDEVRDALTAAGHRRAQVDDWPDVMPALTDLIAERDVLRARTTNPIDRTCGHCGATPGRRCKGPYGRDYLVDGRPAHHAPRRNGEQQ